MATAQTAERVEGIVFGGDIEEYQVVYNPATTGENIEIGKLLSIYDARAKYTYLARVVNIRNGSNQEEAIQAARSILRHGNSEGGKRPETEEADIYEPSLQHRFFFIASCEPLMVINASGGSWTPRTIPFPLSEVRVMNSDILPKSLRGRFGDLPMGVLRSGRDVFPDVEVGLYKRLLPYHIGVFAKTGKGKSNAVFVLGGVVLEMRGEHSMVMFDPHGEYAQQFSRHPLADKYLIQYSRHSQKRIKIGYEDISVKTLLMVNDLMGFSRAQIDLLEGAESLGKDWLRILLTKPLDFAEMKQMEADAKKAEKKKKKTLYEKAKDVGFPEHSPVMRELSHEELSDEEIHPSNWAVDPDEEEDESEFLRDLFRDSHESTIRSVRRKLSRLVEKANYITEHSAQSSIPHIVTQVRSGKSLLIDFTSITGGKLHEMLLMTVVSSRIYDENVKDYTEDMEQFLKNTTPVSIVVEEARRTMGEGVSSNSIFPTICNEGRKYLMGLFTITQQGRHISKDLISQFNTLLILGMADEDDFRDLSKNSSHPIKKLEHEVQAFEPGQGIITSVDSPFAVPIQIYHYDEYLEKVRARVEQERYIYDPPTQSASTFDRFRPKR